jgi:hypothetical protein
MHFLMMLGYLEPTWDEDQPVVRALTGRSGRDEIVIADFGCGLAQHSRTLAAHLVRQGARVRLVLADSPTLRKDFLLWLGAKTNIPTTFLDCTPETPAPKLPACDVLVATEFFEHVHDPLMYFERFNAALRVDGLLITHLADVAREYMHVCTDLGPLRNRIRSLGYEEIQSRRLYRKTAQHDPTSKSATDFQSDVA